MHGAADRHDYQALELPWKQFTSKLYPDDMATIRVSTLQAVPAPVVCIARTWTVPVPTARSWVFVSEGRPGSSSTATQAPLPESAMRQPRSDGSNNNRRTQVEIRRHGNTAAVHYRAGVFHRPAATYFQQQIRAVAAVVQQYIHRQHPTQKTFE